MTPGTRTARPRFQATPALAAVCVGLVLTRPAMLNSEADTPSRAARSAVANTGGPHAVDTLEIKRTAKAFLAGYLAYVYGHGDARAVSDDTSKLARQLAQHPPVVPQGQTLLRPRVLGFTVSLITARQGEVAVLIADTEVLRYRLRLLLRREGSTWLTSGIEGRR